MTAVSGMVRPANRACYRLSRRAAGCTATHMKVSCGCCCAGNIHLQEGQRVSCGYRYRQIPGRQDSAWQRPSWGLLQLSTGELTKLSDMSRGNKAGCKAKACLSLGTGQVSCAEGRLTQSCCTTCRTGQCSSLARRRQATPLTPAVMSGWPPSRYAAPAASRIPFCDSSLM